MKSILLTLSCTLVLATSQFAKAGEAFPGNEQALPVLITLQDKNTNDISYGSGFFLTDSNKIYLVTARHVLFSKGQNIALLQPRAKVSTYSANQTNSIQFTFIFDLEAAQMHEDIKIGTNHDIATLLVALSMTNQSGSERVNLTNMIAFAGPNDALIAHYSRNALGGYADVVVGNDIYIFGYPLSIGLGNDARIDFDRPFLRKGIVAQKSEKAGTFVIDASAYPGNSGGPVVIVSRNASGASYKIIGIVTDEIQYGETWVSTRSPTQPRFLDLSNSGYSIVEPLDAVWDLIRN